MADVSSLLNVIPNTVVPANYATLNPTIASQSFLLGNLPEGQFFLCNKVNTSVRNSMAATAKPGLIVFNTDTQCLEQSIGGTSWQKFQAPLPDPSAANVGQGIVSSGVAGYDVQVINPMTEPGDMIIGGLKGVPVRLPVGSVPTNTGGTGGTGTSEAEAVLTIVSGLPAWGSSGGSSGTHTS